MIDRLKKLHLGAVLGVVVAIYIGFYLVQTVMRNYQLQKQITDLKVQISDLQIEQDQLKYKIAYYQTDGYKEKEARAKLGLQAPGESVIVLPRGANAPTDTQVSKPQDKKSNWQQWVDFLNGRS